MEITLYRHSGHLKNALGRWVPLSVFLNGIKIGSIKTGETKTIILPDGEGNLQVGINKVDEGLGLPNSEESKLLSGCFTTSVIYRITPSDAGCIFELGTNTWVAFDFVSLCYIPALSRRVFFIRKSVDSYEPSNLTVKRDCANTPSRSPLP